jgi:hypothetical protein
LSRIVIFGGYGKSFNCGSYCNCWYHRPDLYLRKVIHPQAKDNYRLILKGDNGLELEIGSIGVKHGSGANGHWASGIDTVIPMREVDAQGTGKDSRDCKQQFRAAWDQFSAECCPADRVSPSEAEATNPWYLR